MTTMVTPREIRSPQNGRVPKVDSPAVSARARARVPVTQSVGKVWALVVSEVAGWGAWTARPVPLRTLWEQSAVADRRVPSGSGVLRVLWRASNVTDRLIMFGLVLAAPTVLTGPLRWLAARPSRRVGFYVTVAGMLAAYLIPRG